MKSKRGCEMEYQNLYKKQKQRQIYEKMWTWILMKMPNNVAHESLI